MPISTEQLSQLIIEHLEANPGMRILALVVAIRRRLGKIPWKGDLSTSVLLALRKLICSRIVVQIEGMYSLAAVPS